MNRGHRSQQKKGYTLRKRNELITAGAHSATSTMLALSSRFGDVTPLSCVAALTIWEDCSSIPSVDVVWLGSDSLSGEAGAEAVDCDADVWELGASLGVSFAGGGGAGEPRSLGDGGGGGWFDALRLFVNVDGGSSCAGPLLGNEPLGIAVP